MAYVNFQPPRGMSPPAATVHGVRYGDGEPVIIWAAPGVRRVRRWQYGNVAEWRCRHVTLGTLPDGRWWVERTGAMPRAFTAETDARAVAESLTAGDGWRSCPAEYGPDAQPTEPGWVKRGGEWWPAEG